MKNQEAKISGNNDENKRGRSLFRPSRSSSRKRDKREKSVERSEDENVNAERGRNPVRFLKKFLRTKKGSSDYHHIAHSSLHRSKL